MRPILKSARQHEWSDLDLDFIAHPTTKDVVRKTGADAIKRSVRNLILTNYYDRPFRSYIGSNAQKILFDNINPLTAHFLKDAIIDTINNFEPRIQLIDDGRADGVVVKVDPEGNGYVVDLTYIIVNRGEPATISIFLERLR
jgi:phage baseplate assembly protein W